MASRVHASFQKLHELQLMSPSRFEIIYRVTHLLGKKTSSRLKFEKFSHPAWAMGSYSRGPPAAKTVIIKATRGFYKGDGSACIGYASFKHKLSLLQPASWSGPAAAVALVGTAATPRAGPSLPRRATRTAAARSASRRRAARPST